MGTPIMINSKLNGNVIDIEDNSTKSGALLDAYPSKAGQPPKLTTFVANQTWEFVANQTWEVLADPDNSGHFLIQNPATGLSIGIQNNSMDRGAPLDVATTKNSQSQLWDFLPDPFGSGYFFIQNPQTGYVIEIKGGSSNSGAALVVNPRRLFDNNFQLWAGIRQDGTAATFPALTLAQPTAVLKDIAQYVLLPTDQTQKLTGITVTLDIIEDLVAEAFSVQINGNPPYPPPKNVSWVTQWLQFGLVTQNNSLILFNQMWGTNGPSAVVESATILALKNNTVPQGTQIVLTLITDNNATDDNAYVTAISAKVYNESGSLIGPKVPPLQAVGELAPLGALQVVVVGPGGGGHAHFTSGMGTIGVACTPDISAQLYWPDPTGSGTGETSNCYYGKVQSGYLPQIVQPFGLPSPTITGVSDAFTFEGTGLLPNSNLTATATFQVVGQFGPVTEAATVSPDPLVSQADGSFAGTVEPPKLTRPWSTLTIDVTDADGNWVQGVLFSDKTVNPRVTSVSALHT